jgi:hypothetical protein
MAPDDIARSIYIGILVWFMIVTPFALPGAIRVARDMWRAKNLPFPRTVAVTLLLAVATMCAGSASLAMLGEFEHLRELAPLAFGWAVLLAMVTNVLLIFGEFAGAMSPRDNLFGN